MSLFEKSKMHLVLFVTRMVVMGFVRATCSRGGSVCKDWFDRAGKMVYWLTRNVLSVDDFMWAKEGMELELPDGSTTLKGPGFWTPNGLLMGIRNPLKFIMSISFIMSLVVTLLVLQCSSFHTVIR